MVADPRVERLKLVELDQGWVVRIELRGLSVLIFFLVTIVVVFHFGLFFIMVVVDLRFRLFSLLSVHLGLWQWIVAPPLVLGAGVLVGAAPVLLRQRCL